MTPIEERGFRDGSAAGCQSSLTKHGIKALVVSAGPEGRTLMISTQGDRPVLFNTMFLDPDLVKAMKAAGFTKMVLQKFDGTVIWTQAL